MRDASVSEREEEDCELPRILGRRHESLSQEMDFFKEEGLARSCCGKAAWIASHYIHTHCSAFGVFVSLR